MGVTVPVLSGYCSEQQMIGKSTLCIKSDTSVLEIGIESLLTLPIVELKADKGVVPDVKCDVPVLGSDDFSFRVLPPAG